MIEAGEYIRTTYGLIGKLVNIHSINYPSPWEIELDNGVILSDEGLGWENFQIKSHSKNLIDLIEVGDFVNGYKVVSIDKDSSDDDYEGIELDRNNNFEYQFIAKNKIKTVLTHEQYKLNCYKVGD